jgi:ABC-type hemin transport system ATPase subunit
LSAVATGTFRAPETSINIYATSLFALASTVLTLMREISRTRGIAILCTLHQPQLAAGFADRVMVMNSGPPHIAIVGH